MMTRLKEENPEQLRDLSKSEGKDSDIVVVTTQPTTSALKKDL